MSASRGDAAHHGPPPRGPIAEHVDHDGSELADLIRTAPPAARRAAFAALRGWTGPIAEPRWTDADVAEACERAAARSADRQVVVVADRPVAAPAGAIVAAAVEDAPPGPAIFVCAFDCDAALVAALRAVRDRGDPFCQPLVTHPPARYAHRDPVARRVLLEEGAIDWAARGLQQRKFDLDDFEMLMQTLAITRDVPGAYVEIGVFQGHSARAALRYLAAAGIRRRAFLVDTFGGFDYPEAAASPDAMWAGTHGGTSEEIVRGMVEGLGDVELVRANVLRDPLPDAADPIAVCNVDVDMYEAVLAALRQAAPRLPVRGILVVEDAGHTPALGGALLALDEFLASPAAAGLLPIAVPSGQTLLVRTAQP